MRRKDREMGPDFARQVLDTCEWAALATVDDRGVPYCVPITIVREGDAIYFHSAMRGEKVDNLRAHPYACLTAAGNTHMLQQEFSTEYESAVARGAVTEVTDPAEKTAALRLLCQRHCPAGMGGFAAAITADLSRTAVWKLALEQITGKRKKCSADGTELKFGAEE